MCPNNQTSCEDNILIITRRISYTHAFVTIQCVSQDLCASNTCPSGAYVTNHFPSQFKLGGNLILLSFKMYWSNWYDILCATRQL